MVFKVGTTFNDGVQRWNDLERWCLHVVWNDVERLCSGVERPLTMVFKDGTTEGEMTLNDAVQR